MSGPYENTLEMQDALLARLQFGISLNPRRTSTGRPHAGIVGEVFGDYVFW